MTLSPACVGANDARARDGRHALGYCPAVPPPSASSWWGRPSALSRRTYSTPRGRGRQVGPERETNVGFRRLRGETSTRQRCRIYRRTPTGSIATTNETIESDCGRRRNATVAPCAGFPGRSYKPDSSTRRAILTLCHYAAGVDETRPSLPTAKVAVGRNPLLAQFAARQKEQTVCPSAYLIPIAIEWAPTRGSTRVAEKPASRIQPSHSAPVYSKPPLVSISMFKLFKRPGVFSRRSSSRIRS